MSVNPTECLIASLLPCVVQRVKYTPSVGFDVLGYVKFSLCLFSRNSTEVGC